MPDTGDARTGSVDLYWLPLGAGGTVGLVRRCGRVYEALVAAREHRRRADLYHSALQVRCGGERYAIESAPAWGTAARERGVVCQGPVGLPALGRSRFFRYEIRRWRDGVIPDLAEAVASPQRLSGEAATARRLLDLVPDFPTVTWGRDELGTGDMWNSNSLISWLLVGAGLDVDAVPRPPRCRAPGWHAGVVAARRAVAPADRAVPPGSSALRRAAAPGRSADVLPPDRRPA